MTIKIIRGYPLGLDHPRSRGDGYQHVSDRTGQARSTSRPSPNSVVYWTRPKCRFGILFSREGITGVGRMSDAEREQLKVFQDRGMVIVVVSLRDLDEVAEGANFMTMMRAKYEHVRLDVLSAPRSPASRQGAPKGPSL